jgi:hypothetical protein
LQTIHPSLKRKFASQIRREIAQSFQDEVELCTNEDESPARDLKSKKGKYEINEMQKKTNNNSKIVSPEPVEISEEHMAVESIDNNYTTGSLLIGSEGNKDEHINQAKEIDEPTGAEDVEYRTILLSDEESHEDQSLKKRDRGGVDTDESDGDFQTAARASNRPGDKAVFGRYEMSLSQKPAKGGDWNFSFCSQKRSDSNAVFIDLSML